MKDRLDRIFELQRAFDERVRTAHGVQFDRETWVQKQVLAMVSELAEILDEVNWKWWKARKTVDDGKIREEVVDLLHFFVSLCLKLDISPDDLYQAYLAKNEENFRRQDGLSEKTGYRAAGES